MGAAQAPIEITHTEISMWLVGPRSHPDPQKIKAQAVITFKAQEAAEIVKVMAQDYSIADVRLREGRDKRKLSFEQGSGMLDIEMAVKPDEQYVVNIFYIIDLSTPELQSYLLNGDNLLSFNPSNARSEAQQGVAGTFFPGLSQSAHNLQLNVTLDPTKSCGFPGILEYKTENGDGTVSEYWRSDNAITAESFYLVIGSFKEFEAKDLEEEFELNAIELRRVRVFNSKKYMAKEAKYLKLDSEGFTDSQYAYVDSLSGLTQSGFFITGNEPQLTVLPKELKRRKALALYHFESDTNQASEYLWKLMAEEGGEDWVNGLMHDKWLKLDDHRPDHRLKVLNHRLDLWKEANPKLFKSQNEMELDTALFEPITFSYKFPKVEIRYRYVARDTALYVHFKQDTSLSLAYTLPIEVTINTEHGKNSEIQIIRGVEGDLKLRSRKIPNLAAVDFGDYFPGTIIDKKPDTYLLYQLGKAQTPAERQVALEGLFETQNKNLFSTALGIALRDADLGIRKRALQNSENLDISAQLKLKDSLLKLTLDDDVEVQNLAKKLVQKYYEFK